MNITRRTALKFLAASAPLLSATRALRAAETAALPHIPPGPFAGTRESLTAYKVPDWFRDAKFGIWNHWGPQSAAEYGDWYARRMYVETEPQYKYHVEKYGHPSKVGFKDVIASWKADKFDPDHLMGLYKKAGAKYYVSMGVHHDGFDLWNSKYQPRWNAVASGPKKDIVGLWRQAAAKHGLRFGVSEHLSNSFTWFGTSHLADKAGPLAGKPARAHGRKPALVFEFGERVGLIHELRQLRAHEELANGADNRTRVNELARSEHAHVHGAHAIFNNALHAGETDADTAGAVLSMLMPLAVAGRLTLPALSVQVPEAD